MFMRIRGNYDDALYKSTYTLLNGVRIRSREVRYPPEVGCWT